MVSTKSPTVKRLTLTQARAIVAAFRISEKVNHARVTSLLPCTTKSAATIIDEILLAYGDVALPYAIGESTIQTALNVAKAWVSLPASVRAKVSKADEVLIFDALVQVRRSNARLADTKIPAGCAVKREIVGGKKFLVGSEKALTHVITALAKEADAEKWRSIAVGAHLVIHGVTLATRRAGKVIPATSDEGLADVTQAHNDSAGDARTGDEKAEKQNRKATRKSKHERDPLEPATPGNSEEQLPASGSGAGAPAGGNPKAPAKILALADATPAQLIAALKRQIASGSVRITPAMDATFTDLVEIWEEQARATHTSEVAAKPAASTVKRGQAAASKRARKAEPAPTVTGAATPSDVVVPITPAGTPADVARAKIAAANDAARKAREAVLASA